MPLKLAPQCDAIDERHTACDDVPLVYIAAPFASPDPVANTHAVIRIADGLLHAGFTPFIPHLSLAWQLVSPKPYDTWLSYDRHLLARCDLLLRVPGHSEGATQECEFAEELGIPVIQSRSADPTDCVAAVMLHRRLSKDVPHKPRCVPCTNCSGFRSSCSDCHRCHLCCRCGAGES